mmetsp:Transcript_31482/g.102270  ORF Transcript_31482/g.102270 Transcript_31482/m.102270 type:complete len:687 (-) Transcript_31482:101-2161(-)
MCKAVEKDHLFGSSHNLDDPILDCFMTYGLEPTNTGASGYKRVEIILQVDETLVPDSMKDKSPDSTLKHGDIVYHREKIGDLNKEDANMRTAYFKAVTEEMSALCALKFAEVTIIPETRDPISTRFVLKVKRKADGSFDRVKARLVVRGFMQRIGLDFYTSYSPMATLASCRLVLAAAVKHKVKCHQIDIPNAFIQGNAERDMFINLPTGLALSEACIQDMLKGKELDLADRKKYRIGLRLLKALYGLKQAPLLWNLRIDKFFQKHGFERQSADACLYRFQEEVDGEIKWVLLSVSVDDILCTGTHDKKIDSLKQALNEEFSIVINGETKNCTWTDYVESFLGILVTGRPEHGKITLSVPGKIADLIKEIEEACGTKVHEIKSLTTPDKKDVVRPGKLKDYLKENFARVVGCTIYMSITCRPDICTWVSRTARGMHDPQETHLYLAYRLLMYLKGTRSRGLNFSYESPIAELLSEYQEAEGKEIKSEIQNASCYAFSDANWADATDEKLRSTSGFCIYVFGCLVSWHSKRQTLTAASTMQAELIAAATCADEVKWFTNILIPNKLIFGEFVSVPLFVDNQAALSVSNHPKMSASNKFVDLREYRIRDYQKEGIIRPVWIPGNLNPADLFTKLLGRTLFMQNTRLLGMSTIPSDSLADEQNRDSCLYSMANKSFLGLSPSVLLCSSF